MNEFIRASELKVDEVDEDEKLCGLVPIACSALEPRTGERRRCHRHLRRNFVQT